MSRFWSHIVNDLTPYTPGEQPQIDNLIKLNTNENPYGPSPKVIEAITKAASVDLRKYPDPNCRELKNTIADYFGLTQKQVFVGNSSDEVLAHSFRAFFMQNAPVLTPDISYSFYPPVFNLFGIAYEHIPLRDDFSLNVDDYKRTNGGTVFANPNAPTGMALTVEKLEELLKTNTDSVVIIDEAYVDFHTQSAVQLIKDYPNLLVTQTLSKSRGLAGLRVGLALGNENLIEGLERVKNSFHPYTLDTLAIAGATAAFKDKQYFTSTVKRIVNTRDKITKALAELGFTVLPSAANFVFATHKRHDALYLFNALRERNIIIRYFDAPRINNYIRISIGSNDEMAVLINALTEILAANNG